MTVHDVNLQLTDVISSMGEIDGFSCFMWCLHDLANVQQTSSRCIQNTRANAGRLLDRINTLSVSVFKASGVWWFGCSVLRDGSDGACRQLGQCS